MNAVDTNVLVYLLDEDEIEKRPKAVALINSLVLEPEKTVMLWQVIGELLAVLRRWQENGRVTQTILEDHINNFLSMFDVVIPTKRVISKSLALSTRYSVSHWDSMVLAACVEAGVDTLYSEDLSTGVTYDSVTVVNPFG